MEPWTPHALKYRRTDTGTGKSNGESGESSETGTGKGTSGDSLETGQGKGNSNTCVICGVYQVFSGRTDESCPRKRGQPCQFVTVLTQKGDDGAAEDEKQKGKGNSGEQKGKGKHGFLSQDEFERLSRLPSWMHDKRYSYDITEADVWAVERTYKGNIKGKIKSNGESGDSFETGKGKSSGEGKSGDFFTQAERHVRQQLRDGQGQQQDRQQLLLDFSQGKGNSKSGDSLTGKGKSKSGDSCDPDDSSPRSQASTYPLPSEWASAFEEAYAQEQDESPARPLRRWASGVLTSPPSYTVPDGLDDPTPEDPREVPEDPLEVTDPNNPHEVPGPQEGPPRATRTRTAC